MDEIFFLLLAFLTSISSIKLSFFVLVIILLNLYFPIFLTEKVSFSLISLSGLFNNS